MSRYSHTDGLLTLECERIARVAPILCRSGATLTMEVQMTKAQMRAMVEQIVARISTADWTTWVEETTPEVAALLLREAMEREQE
jgi:hypothetical protein